MIFTVLDYERNWNELRDDNCAIDLMHDDVTHPERQYGSCSRAQIQDGRQ